MRHIFREISTHGTISCCRPEMRTEGYSRVASQEFFHENVNVGHGIVVGEVWESPVAHTINFALSLPLHFRIDSHGEEE